MRCDDAERRYGRARYKRITVRALIATGSVALALAAGSVVVRNSHDDGRSDEVAATPAASTPAPTPTSSPTATPTVTWSPTVRPTPNAKAKPNRDGRPARAELVDDPRPAVTPLLNPAHKVIRAWSVPEMHGHVLLSERDGMRCLSIPDRLANEPDAERGLTCNPGGRFGISIKVGNDYAAVVNPDAAHPPLLKLRDGTRRALDPGPAGLIAFVAMPPGSSISLYDSKGNRRTDGFRDLP